MTTLSNININEGTWCILDRNAQLSSVSARKQQRQSLRSVLKSFDNVERAFDSVFLYPFANVSTGNMILSSVVHAATGDIIVSDKTWKWMRCLHKEPFELSPLCNQRSVSCEARGLLVCEILDSVLVIPRNFQLLELTVVGDGTCGKRQHISSKRSPASTYHTG